MLMDVSKHRQLGDVGPLSTTPFVAMFSLLNSFSAPGILIFRPEAEANGSAVFTQIMFLAIGKE
jgi:hypothetical protein